MRFKDKETLTNSERAYRYLVAKKGLDPNVAAGLLGNLMQESYMLDRTWEEGNVDDVGSLGVMQWHGKRLNDLYDFYTETHPDYKRGEEIPLNAQLDFVLYEAETGAGDPWLKKQYQKAFSASTPREAALNFSKYVVRPHKDYAHNDKRVEYAQMLANSYQEDYDYFNDPEGMVFEESNRKKKAKGNLDKSKQDYEWFIQGQIDPSQRTQPKQDNRVASMQSGGESKQSDTLKVDSKNHPRYKAYQDSLYLYNTQNKLNAQYLSNFKEIDHPEGHEPNVDLWEMVKQSPKTLKKGYGKRQEVVETFLNDKSKKGVVNIPPNDKTEYGYTRNIIGDKLHAGKYKTNAEANENNLFDRIGIFDDDTKSTVPYNEVTTKDNNRVYITPQRKAWDAKDGVLGTSLGKKDNDRYYSGYTYEYVTHPKIKPVSEVDYHYATDAHNSQGRTSTKKAHKIDPTDWTYDDGRLFNVNIKHYKKPEQFVEVKGEEPTKPRPRVSPISSTIDRGEINFPKDSIQGKLFNIPKEAPNVEKWEISRDVEGATGTSTTSGIYNTDEAHRMLLQQRLDEESYWGDENKLRVKPKYQKGGEIVPRQGVRINSKGEEETHLMKREYVKGKGWVAFPTLYQDKNGEWLDLGKKHTKDWTPIYKEALKRGEVYNFGEDLDAAIKFADEGSWKKAIPKAQRGRKNK